MLDEEEESRQFENNNMFLNKVDKVVDILELKYQGFYLINEGKIQAYAKINWNLNIFCDRHRLDL